MRGGRPASGRMVQAAMAVGFVRGAYWSSRVLTCDGSASDFNFPQHTYNKLIMSDDEMNIDDGISSNMYTFLPHFDTPNVDRWSRS